MFNEANVKNRLRHYVRGRVLVFTTSRVVEFLQENLKRSVVLYSSVDGYPAKHGVSFLVELDGFLTFDDPSEYRIIELGPYKQAFYDGSAFRIAAPADGPEEVVLRVMSYAIHTSSQDGSIIYQCAVRHSSPPGAQYITTYFSIQNGVGSRDFFALMEANFAVGSLWLGDNAYRGFEFLLSQTTV